MCLLSICFSNYSGFFLLIRFANSFNCSNDIVFKVSWSWKSNLFRFNLFKECVSGSLVAVLGDHVSRSFGVQLSNWQTISMWSKRKIRIWLFSILVADWGDRPALTKKV